MPTFKNTQDILSNPWQEKFSEETARYPYIPKSLAWDQNIEMTVSDVVLWEQLYYEPGNVGVYAAYNPYAEFYLITYNLFFETELKFETFYGENAAQQCFDRTTELGIYLNFS